MIKYSNTLLWTVLDNILQNWFVVFLLTKTLEGLNVNVSEECCNINHVLKQSHCFFTFEIVNLTNKNIRNDTCKWKRVAPDLKKAVSLNIKLSPNFYRDFD